MSTTRVSPTTSPALVLEPAAQAFADALAAAGGPPLYTLSPQDARAVLDRAQAGDVVMPPAEVEPHTIPGGPDSEISITVVRPVDSNGHLPAVVYTHGGGWILGSFATHERLVRNLVAQSGAAFVFVNYTPSPEAHYPVAIEQVYATAKWAADYGAELGLNGRRLAVAGESVGGNMTAAVTLLAKERGGPAICFQALLYPVTNAAFDTAT
jgi:acetyl esterase